MVLKGIYGVYKPKGPTSHDIIDRLRKMTGEQRIGHAGTLDPLASGVLVVGIGREATRRLGEVVKKEKEYIADIFLGVESVTDDAEGLTSSSTSGREKMREIEKREKKEIEIEKIEKVANKFKGLIQQAPPIYSAIKVKGEKAYEAARQGKALALKPREVEIKDIQILKYEWPHLMLKVITGPGVYIRALARDIGRELKVGGYLFDLERTRVGQFTKEEALKNNSSMQLTINEKYQLG